jgi:hypothetical protein
MNRASKALPGLLLAGGLSVLCVHDAAAAEEDTSVVAFHYQPVPDLQVAIWLEDADGNFIRDIFITQATGKLGIGNRPGIWNFLSSWRFPYGPRTNVLPVWGHRRGVTYPKLVFHDPKEGYQDSLGWHESTSSDENYFCRPLTADENEVILDVMSCPSPTSFHSDKGMFLEGETSVYPPRNDILEIDPERDHPDVESFTDLNDLDAVTGATPSGVAPTFEAVSLAREDVGDGPLVAWIEVSLEHDENSNWEFDRENDHYVDTKLAGYGVEWLGQPSVVYRVEFLPGEAGYTVTDSFFGYGSFEGGTGDISPPDGTISLAGGSGADRLQRFTHDGAYGRFGIEVSGWSPTDGDGGGSGGCATKPLPPVVDLHASPRTFDRVELDFEMPADLPADIDLHRLNVYYYVGEDAVDASDLNSALVQEFTICEDKDDVDCDLHIEDGHGVISVDELWGDYSYQFAVVYEDRCSFESQPAMTEATTPLQKFQTIDTFCVVATAAWGASWHDEVVALRRVRDRILKPSSVGNAFVGAYYNYGPSLAWWLSKNAYARGVARVLLSPLADAAKLIPR